MSALDDAVVELYRKAATSLPPDVVNALSIARSHEAKGSRASLALSVILENIRAASKSARPLCQDTGIPVFFLRIPACVSYREVKNTIVKGTKLATRAVPLRPNAVDTLTEKNSEDNTGTGFPVIYCDEARGNRLIIDLMLKGSGSENIGQTYKLPDEALFAERELDGVRKCVLDAVQKAQGRGCPPYIIGVGVGATRDQVTRLSKEQLLRRLDDANRHPILARLEKTIRDDVNALNIGPVGLGGRTTALAVKIAVNYRHPATYFVDVSVACWADRRARLIYDIQNSKYRIQS